MPSDLDRTIIESDPQTVDSRSPMADTDPPTGRRLAPTMAESDPPTVLVRRDGCVDLPPGSIVGEIYEIDAKLGAGAMGEVYAARHVRLGKRVAIKVIGPRLSEDAAAIERFAQEARALAQVQHPAIVAVEHVGELADGRAFFVMEFLRGESLFERISRGRVPFPEALRILDQMARGLEAAHAHGVTHRDLKPENTYLVHLPGEAPIIKLLDFGLAKLAADVDRRAERTQSGVAIGTPMYMSPEQMRGPDVDYRTDVYALGCVAYELVLGLPPFPHAKTAPEFYAAHLHESPCLPRSIWPEIPPQLDLALFAMLAKDPRHRPTLAQVRSVVAAVRTTTSQRAATEFVAQRMPMVKAGIVAISAATLISGVVIGAVLTSKPRGEASHETTITAPVAPVSVPTTLTGPTVAIDAAPSAPVRRLRTAGGSGTTSTTPSQLTISGISRPTPPTKVSAIPIDAGIDAVIMTIDVAPTVIIEKTTPKPKPNPRNQTVNPFAKHHRVNP